MHKSNKLGQNAASIRRTFLPATLVRFYNVAFLWVTFCFSPPNYPDHSDHPGPRPPRPALLGNADQKIPVPQKQSNVVESRLFCKLLCLGFSKFSFSFLTSNFPPRTLILDSQKYPWEVSFSISNLSKHSLAEAYHGGPLDRQIFLVINTHLFNYLHKIFKGYWSHNMMLNSLLVRSSTYSNVIDYYVKRILRSNLNLNLNLLRAREVLWLTF